MQILMGSKFIPTPTEVESEEIDVDEIFEGGREAFLVGRLVTEKLWNPSYLIEEITEAWKMKNGGMSSKEWGDLKLILFRFDDVMDRDWVLKNQPWHFKGSLFAIKEFTGGNEQQLSSLDNVTIDHASFWARLYNVPVSCMNERSLRIFAKQIGILESVDKSDEDSIGRFLRFKISVNIMKPLLRGITIRAKGKHLWLPLKYESLPKYCFCCGTVGHDRENCQSCNQNMEYSVCKLRASSSKRRERSKCSLPFDIIENILSRVPVKYLLRLKAVSKQWKYIISRPIFAEVHLQQYKQSSSRYLVCDLQGFYLTSFQNQELKFVSAIEQTGEYRLMPNIKCYCDGLYLLCPINNKHVLWNPSCRAYKEILCPKTYLYKPLIGIYYNQLMKDYRLVFADSFYYAVFSCRYNKWSQVKMMKYYCHNDDNWWGLHFNGSFYWLISRPKNGKPYPPRRLRRSEMEFEILCFDGRDENFKKLSVPYCEGIAEWSCLSSGGHLCLFGKGWLDEIFIFKKVNGDEKDSWTEFKLQLEYRSRDFDYHNWIFWISENQFIIYVVHEQSYLLYDLCANTRLKIPNIGYGKLVCPPAPYLENLFLQ